MPKKNYPIPGNVNANAVPANEQTGAKPNLDYDPHLEKHLNEQMQKRKRDTFL
ncbi:MAG: hypothetical protein FWE21_02210 [Defluviitaleaceae bacterium]|nr:hypothetical protein [Defluviitaleaceae bacterium]